jgi:hypothetical protein
MEIKEFIEHLTQRYFSLTVNDGKLVLKGDKNNLTAAEIDAIRSDSEVIDFIKIHKQEIIDYLLTNIKSLPKSNKDIVSVYRLSGLQQGMLFHGLYDNSGNYMEQFSFELSGVNIPILIKSWQELLNNHTILRSAFNYDSFKIPVQCVYQDVELPIQQLDFRHLNQEETLAAIIQYETNDRLKGFDLKVPPLIRVGLLRIKEDRYRMIWTCHHLLFDGWSLPIMMEEFFQTYEKLLAGLPAPVRQEDKYEDYIRFLEQRDRHAEEVYWRERFNGLHNVTLLPFLNPGVERTKGGTNYRSLSITLDANESLQMNRYVQSNSLTLSTLMQGVWAFLLSRYTNESDVVYGVTVSGRPAELPDVENRVGMFINTIPFRTQLNDSLNFTNWLQNIQSEQVHARQFQYTPLSDIKGWAEVKRYKI